jgi:hypothetical protein
MSTLIELGLAIENDYKGDIATSVKVCRPNMAAPISASNLPYIRETIGVPDSQAAGVVYGYFMVKGQTSLSGDYAILNVGCMMERDNPASYSLLAEGKVVLDNYKSFYRPFETESDNLLTHILNYFRDVRNLIFVKKINIQIGTPVYGNVQGIRLIGDGGATEFDSRSETWVFKAVYPWGTSGNITSWKQ